MIKGHQSDVTYQMIHVKLGITYVHAKWATESGQKLSSSVSARSTLARI